MTTDLRSYQFFPAPAEPAPAEPVFGATLAEARQLYIRTGYQRFEAVFARCDAAGRMKPGLSIFNFIFGLGPPWLFYRKMYREGLIFTGLMFALSLAAQHLPALRGGLALVRLILSLGLVLYGPALYWKSVDRQMEMSMSRYPREPDRALAWLKATGGVNLPAALILGTLAYGLASF
ncbi:MAG: DUF2628 domain-containing protein [Candidatus Adiutrix sp.]|jgi:hypothetical protein|nr:DUF2628 domain-containing protein [Candidatus Adiutrix sp.]